jgi:hypothetical protein
MRRCSGFLVAIAVWCAGLAAGAQAAPVLLSESAGEFALSPGRIVWESGSGLLGRSRAVTGVVTEAVGDGVDASSTLAAWQEIVAVGGHLPTLLSFRQAVALPSGRVVDLVSCLPDTRRCGCITPARFEDLEDPTSSYAVDGDRVAVGRPGCARGVTIYERAGDRLRVRAFRRRASTSFLLRGRHLVWLGYRGFRASSVTVYDWTRDRIAQRFRHLPFPDGDLTLTIGPGGQLLARAQSALGIGAVTLLLHPDGTRTRLRGIASAVFTGPHEMQSVSTHPWRRVAIDLRTGRRSRLPVARPPATASAVAYDRHCLAWKTDDGALWVDSIDGRPSRAPACTTG